MKYFLITLFVLTLSACSSNQTENTNEPLEWNIGEKAEALYGCEKLREELKEEANC